MDASVQSRSQMSPDRLGSACLKVVAAAGAVAGGPVLAEAPDRNHRLGTTYTSDNIANIRGGLKTGFSQMGLLEVTGDARGKVFGIEGVEAHVSAQYVHGRSLSAKLIGDAQVSSNIDAPDGLRLFEGWISVPIARDAYLKAGMIDLNSEFDVQNTGALFLNSSHGIGPDFSQSGLNGPSIFPTTSSAIITSVTRGRMTFRAGLFDAIAGDPDHPRRTVIRPPGKTGLLLVGEAELRFSDVAEVQAGAWCYSNSFEAIPVGNVEPDDRERGNCGAYILADGRLGTVQRSPVNAWIRAGSADRRFNPIAIYVGGGVTVGREGRKFGLSIAHARLGRRARNAGSSRAETLLEATYAHAIGERITVQPDVQLVLSPAFDRTLRNSLSAGVRVQLTLF